MPKFYQATPAKTLCVDPGCDGYTSFTDEMLAPFMRNRAPSPEMLLRMMKNHSTSVIRSPPTFWSLCNPIHLAEVDISFVVVARYNGIRKPSISNGVRARAVYTHTFRRGSKTVPPVTLMYDVAKQLHAFTNICRRTTIVDIMLTEEFRLAYYFGKKTPQKELKSRALQHIQEVSLQSAMERFELQYHSEENPKSRLLMLGAIYIHCLLFKLQNPGLFEIS